MTGSRRPTSLREALVVLGVAPRDDLTALSEEEYAEFATKLRPSYALYLDDDERAPERWHAAVAIVQEALPIEVQDRHRLRKVGALDVVGGFAFSRLGEFEAMIEPDAAEVVERYLADLELDDLLRDEPPDLESLGRWIERRVCRALGVDRADWGLPTKERRRRDQGGEHEAAREADLGSKRNKAALLSACIEACRRQNRGDLEAHGLFYRLIEWWRWRRLGHDKGAMIFGRNMRALLADQGGGRAEVLAERRAEARAWREEARRLAAQIWATAPALSASAVAKRIAVGFRKRGIVSANGTTPSGRSICGAIADLKPSAS